MPSVEHEQLAAMMAGGLGLEELSVGEQRAAMEAMAETYPADPEMVVSEVDAGGVPADWITANPDETDRVVAPADLHEACIAAVR